MKLLEFQGKRLFAEHGIPIPPARLLAPGEDPSGVAPPVVLKAQVMTGGRGKAGGIRIVRNADEIPRHVSELFAMRIQGEQTAYVLAQNYVDIERELYLAITARGDKGEPVIIAGGAGGVEIENIAKADPANITVLPIDPAVGITAYTARYIAGRMGLADQTGFQAVLRGLYEVFHTLDAALVEINPLAVTPQGLVAMDAKVQLDDKARYRHPELFAELEREQGPVAEHLRDDTITFVGLQGDVALISDGAGTGMLALDMIKDAGGSLASFCELGGVTDADVMYTALQESLSHPGGARCLLVVLIGGFNRMDHMAEGILRCRQECADLPPMVVRMCGTMEAEGKAMLAAQGIATVDDLGQAVATAVQLAKEGVPCRS